MGRIKITESVKGNKVEDIHTYKDIENHHPSKNFAEANRSYAIVDGDKEEVLKEKTLGGNTLVSKDFILTDTEKNTRKIHVPAPASGFIGKVDASNGVIRIYEKIGGELLAQIRHMDLRKSKLEVGQAIRYGDPLGVQGGFGSGDPSKYGVHVHVDYNVKYLDQFKQYIIDIDTGVITTDGYSGALEGVQSWAFPFKNLRGKEIKDASAYIGAPAPVASEASFTRADNGFFPIGANGLWHGGVHFDAGTGTLLDQHEGVRCVRDGEVIAYFVDKQYPEIEFTASKKKAAYSTSFTLVKHVLELPTLPKEKQAANEQSPWSTIDWKLPFQNTTQLSAPAPMLGPVGMHVTKEPAKEKKETLTFFSLYMHQLDWLEYDSKQALSRPAYWAESKTRFRVGEKAKDKQAIAQTPLDMIDASEEMYQQWFDHDMKTRDPEEVFCNRYSNCHDDESFA
jgi:hypothetical protein